MCLIQYYSDNRQFKKTLQLEDLNQGSFFLRLTARAHFGDVPHFLKTVQSCSRCVQMFFYYAILGYFWSTLWYIFLFLENCLFCTYTLQILLVLRLKNFLLVFPVPGGYLLFYFLKMTQYFLMTFCIDVFAITLTTTNKKILFVDFALEGHLRYLRTHFCPVYNPCFEKLKILS